MLPKQHKEKFILFQNAKGPHHGGESMAVNGERTMHSVMCPGRKQGGECSYLSPLSSLIVSVSLAHVPVLLTFRVSVPSSVKHLRRHPQNHTRMCISQVTLNPVRLTSKTYCYKYDDSVRIDTETNGTKEWTTSKSVSTLADNFPRKVRGRRDGMLSNNIWMAKWEKQN